MLKVLLTLVLVFSVSYGSYGSVFNDSQKHIIRKSYNIGKLIKAKDGMTFEHTLSSIAFTESSAGKYIIGDKFSKKLKDASLGVYQIRLETAKFIIKRDKFLNKHFKYLLKDNDALISMLLREEDFGALVAGHLLKFWYEYALRKGVKNPWFYAVSRYNGGTKNVKYVNRIRKNMKVTKRLIK
jgi:hypothetical protein